MNLIDRNIYWIDHNAEQLQTIAGAYRLANDDKQREIYRYIYNKHERQMNESMELVWVLVRAEMEGVVL